MNNNLFPGLGKDNTQIPPPEPNRSQVPSDQNSLNQESFPATSNVASMFRFGTASNIVFGQRASNEAPRASAPGPRPILPRRRPGHQEATAPSFVFNPNMTEEQVNRLIAPLPTNQAIPTVRPANLNRFPLAAQPVVQNQAFSLFPHLHSRSDLGTYSGQIGTTTSQPASTSFPVQDATTSMHTTSNLNDYYTHSQQFNPCVPTVLETATNNLSAQLSPNDVTSINSIQNRIIAASNNAQSNGPRLSLFPRLVEVSSSQAQTHNLSTSATSTPSSSTQMIQPFKISNACSEDNEYKNPLDFTRKVKVIGGARTHPCIKFMDPIPELPASVDPEYIEEMMAINLAGRDIFRELLSKNPFYILDDIVDNMIEDIEALDEKFPGCREAMAQLEFSYNKPTSRPFESSSLQSTSKIEATSYKPDIADNIIASSSSFKPPSTPISIQPSSNMAPISQAFTEAATSLFQPSAAPSLKNPTSDSTPVAFQLPSSVATTSFKDTSSGFQFSAVPNSSPFGSAVTQGNADSPWFANTSSFDAARPTNSRKRVSEEEHERRPMAEETPAKAAFTFKSAEAAAMPSLFSNTSISFDAVKPTNSRKRVSEEEHERRPMGEETPAKVFSFKSALGVPTNSSLTTTDAPKENSKLEVPLAESSKVNLASGSSSASMFGVSCESTSTSQLNVSSTGDKPSNIIGTTITPMLDAPQLNISFKSTKAPTDVSSNLSVAPETSSSKPKFSFGLSKSSLFGDDSAKVSNTDSLAEPAQGKQNTFITQDANFSETETVDEEGFNGTRTNDALILKGVGEEEEVTLAQARIKLSVFDVTSKAYKDLGVGILKVNLHQTSDCRRLICRAEGSGHILMNSYIPDDINAKVVPKSSLRFKAFSLDGVPTVFLARFKELSDAELLESVMKKE